MQICLLMKTYTCMLMKICLFAHENKHLFAHENIILLNPLPEARLLTSSKFKTFEDNLFYSKH